MRACACVRVHVFSYTCICVFGVFCLCLCTCVLHTYRCIVYICKHVGVFFLQIQFKFKMRLGERLKQFNWFNLHVKIGSMYLQTSGSIISSLLGGHILPSVQFAYVNSTRAQTQWAIETDVVRTSAPARTAARG